MARLDRLRRREVDLLDVAADIYLRIAKASITGRSIPDAARKAISHYSPIIGESVARGIVAEELENHRKMNPGKK